MSDKPSTLVLERAEWVFKKVTQEIVLFNKVRNGSNSERINGSE